MKKNECFVKYQVPLLRPGVRDPVPATLNGGALQGPLQHLRVFGCLHRGHLLPGNGRGGHPRPAPHFQVNILF